MIIYTGAEADLNKIHGYEKNNNRIEVATDSNGLRYIPHEVVTYPDFQELKPIFDKLTPIEYTPNVEPN